MSESEHSDSEFYYPGELSDVEMLQLPTHREATERKSRFFGMSKNPILGMSRNTLGEALRDIPMAGGGD